MTPWVNSFLARYAEAKSSLGDKLGATEALLHVHVGLLIFVVTALLLRRRMASAWPVAVVAALAVLNEVVDFCGPSPAPYWRSGLDILNTIFWPAVLFVLARRGKGVRAKI